VDPSTSRDGRTTVLVVEDHEIMRQGLVHLIEQQTDLAVCGEADTIQDARRAVCELRPDVAIIDITLKDGNATGLIKDIRQRQPETTVLVLSMHNELVYAERALRAGARGYVSKSEASATVIEAVRRVVAGELYVSSEVASVVLSRMGGDGPDGRLPMDRLTDRELEVFELIGEGLRTREIAARLHLSAKTIETYRESIKHKLGLENATQMIVRAVQWVQFERGS
jgi:DNA-binding NarL/FixJ family response regulator